MTLEQFHIQLVKRQREIEEQMFDSLPRDWADFQHRVGAHQEVTRLVNDITAAIKGKEDDQQ